ncbi:anthranilate synthase component I family protein [Synechococcus sp. UW140]|uniref:anthranilate synthase component I family protein n=1 Tax=Synechococcus sp. UW140 TaxID=368503 RepID=UPI003137DF6B
MTQLPWWDPSCLATAMARHFGEEGLVWLDGDGSQLGQRALLAAAPQRQLRCCGLPGQPGSADPFDALEEIQQNRNGIWLGWLAYEAGAWVEPGRHWQKPDMATLWAGCYGVVVQLDLQHQQLWLSGDGPQRQALEALIRSGPELSEPAVAQMGVAIDQWHWHTTISEFERQVATVQAWIGAGDLFQANLTACAEHNLTVNSGALQLYQRLRRRCPAPFGGVMVASNAEAVLSASPERFLSCDAAGNVETRPIKGTRPRHQDPDLDAAAAAELVSSPKDRAENVMIVDLLRNDLGRVCTTGSIEVPQLVGLESYAQVHHLTSVVSGKLRPDQNPVALLRACWPGGSITGAPKISACSHLNQLEPVARGPYCGSFFRFNVDGSFDSNLLIRSVMLRDKRLRIHGGCGIVADSNPEQEAAELGWKIQPLLAALS